MINSIQRLLLCSTLVVATLTAGKVFSSKSTSHIFPVTDFQVEHLHDESDFTGGVLPNGVHQPFPDVVKISFAVPDLDKSFEFKLTAAKDLVHAESFVQVHEADGTVTEQPHRLVTYTSSNDEEGNLVTATIFGDNFASVTFISGSKDLAFQVLPAGHHEEDMEPEYFEELKNSLEQGLVYHQITQDDADSSVANAETDVARRLLQRFPTNADRWVGCNGGSATDEFIMTVGFALDTGFVNTVRRATNADPMAFVQQIVSTSNMVYRPEMGVILQIGETVVKTGLDGDVWNQDRAGARTCGIDISTTLNNLNRWRLQTRGQSAMGLWQLMTDCYPPPGTVGVAYVGTICNARGNNVGVNTYSGPRTWLTVAHEIGHNFGGAHSFELGQGRTGGIMDYADGTLNGVYTFNRRFREADMCPTIRRARQNARGLTANCLAPAGSAPAPGTTAAPVTTAAPATPANWVAGQFGACSAACGNAGVQTRTVRCVQGTQTVSDNLCNAATRPAAQQPCNRVACTGNPTPAPTSAPGPVPTQTPAPGPAPATRQITVRLTAADAARDINARRQIIQDTVARFVGVPNTRVVITRIVRNTPTDYAVTFYVLAALMQDVYTMGSAFEGLEERKFTELEMMMDPEIVMKNILELTAELDAAGAIDHGNGFRITAVELSAEEIIFNSEISSPLKYGLIAGGAAVGLVAVVAIALVVRARRSRVVVKSAITQSFVALSERTGAI